MYRLRAFAVRVLNLLRRNRLEQDLREQLEAHAQMLEDELARRGMEPSAARVASRRAIGSQTLAQQLAREQHAFATFESLSADLRLAARRLARQPGTTIIAMLALGGGIGATAATWSLVSALLLNPLPVQDPDRLVIVGSRFNEHSYPMYTAVRESGVFGSVAGVGSREVLLGRDRPAPAVAYFASHDFFDLLGVRPALGRDFVPEDDRRGAPLVAMLSDGYWRRVFGARPEALGAEVVVSGRRAVVVGVAPRRFRGLDLTEPPDIYLPLHAVEIADATDEGLGFLQPDASNAVAWVTIVGRLPSGAGPAQAAARLTALFPETVSGAPAAVTQLNAAAIPQTAFWAVGFGFLIVVTMGLLLAIGCLAAGVLLMRTEARRDELAMCLALGASRGRLLRGVVMEGGLLALGGTLLGLPASAWIFAGVRAFRLQGGVQVDLLALSLDTSAMLAAGAAAAAATCVSAALAGSYVWSVGAASGQRPQAGATPRLSRTFGRITLGAGQVAISLVLLAGAALFARSIAGALAFGPSDDVRRLVTGTINPLTYGYTDEEASAFFDAVRLRLSGHPAIEAVSMAKPYTNMQGGATFVDGQERKFPSYVYYQGVDAQYFQMFGMPLIAGRTFSSADRAEARLVAIVSESFGRLLAEGGDPIGRSVWTVWSPDTAEIVGVVPDVITNLTLRSPYVIYMPIEQMPGPTPRTLFLRTAVDPAVAIRETVSAIRALDRAMVPPPMQTVGDRIDEQMRAQQFGMFAMSAVGIAAALLTALGIYVLAESLARRRRRELAIRSALGASGGQLGLIVLRDAGLQTGLGVLAGTGIVWAGFGPIRGFLFQVEPFDPASVAIASVLLLLVILVVSLKPARAAMRVDVARILAEE